MSNLIPGSKFIEFPLTPSYFQHSSPYPHFECLIAYFCYLASLVYEPYTFTCSTTSQINISTDLFPSSPCWISFSFVPFFYQIPLFPLHVWFLLDISIPQCKSPVAITVSSLLQTFKDSKILSLGPVGSIKEHGKNQYEENVSYEEKIVQKGGEKAMIDGNQLSGIWN